MTEGAFGPSGKRLEKPSHREQQERFAKIFGREIEPEVEVEPEPVEYDWGDASRKNAYTEYLRRHPEKKPKPREIKKLGQIAPGVDGGEYLAKLIEQIKGLAENYALFQERLAAFEQKQLDECTSRGQNFRWIDGECLALDVNNDGANPENVAAKAAESATVDRIMDKVVRKGKLFTKEIALDGGWTILSGRGA